MSDPLSGGHLHLPQHAGQPHGGGHSDLEVQVGALEFHDHPKELVRFGLVGHRLQRVLRWPSPWCVHSCSCEDLRKTRACRHEMAPARESRCSLYRMIRSGRTADSASDDWPSARH